MKSFLTVSFLLLIFSCSSVKVNESISSIEYTATTRGSSKNIILKNKTLVYKINNEEKIISISSNERKKLDKIINEINISEISNLTSPTNKRMYDGAMRATLKIRKNKKEYKSSTFDDGHPPTELETLIKELEKLTKK